MLLSVVLMSFLCSLVCAQDTTPSAPDFTLEDLNGNSVRLSSLLGSEVVLLFGRTDCRHCNAILPTLARSWEQYCHLNIYFIAVGQSSPEVLDFFFGTSMTFEVLPDPDGLVSTKYAIDRVPTCVFINSQGQIIYRGLFHRSLVDAWMKGDAPSDITIPDSDPSNRPLPQQKNRKWEPPRRFIVELEDSPQQVKRSARPVRQQRSRALEQKAKQIGGRIIHNYGRWKNRIVVEMDPTRLERLRELPGFKSVKVDRKVHALIADSAYQIKADYAWANAITGQGVNVCVVDTGIDWSHPDLLNKVVKQYDFFEGDEDAMDDNGHGTHVAGIIASQGLTYRGISYDVALMGARVLGANGDGYASDVALGIQWCVEEGADVINLSLGEGLYTDTCDGTEMAQAVNEAVDAGAIVVCASGNDGNPNEIVSPACASKAIAVGSVDKLDNIASYSDGGKELDLVAPGGDQLGGEHYPEITAPFSTLVAEDPWLCMYFLAEQCYDDWFTVEGGRYIRAVGTSMAAPHVAAAAALILEANPSLTPIQVKELLQSTADDFGATGWDNVFGWGRINLERAMDNLPAAGGELTVGISSPAIGQPLVQEQTFDLIAGVDCHGGEGCGQIDVTAEFCPGQDCSDFTALSEQTVLSTLDTNPVEVGALSGITIDTQAPVLFDVETIKDISENTYTAIGAMETATIGSTLALEYKSDDLEPEDGIGANGEDAQKIYEFTIPPGVPRRLMVQMEHFFVLQFDFPPPAGWRVELSDSIGNSLGLIGEDIPISGGGGEPPPPDSWFITEDPDVLAALNPSGTNYLNLTSFGVDTNDWLTFNNLYVIVEYEVDPDNDWVHNYYVQFDLSGIDPNNEITAARLNLTVAQGAAGSTAELHLADNTLTMAMAAETIHNVDRPAYTSLLNPLKTFGAEQTGMVSINLMASVIEALEAGQDRIAFAIRERNNDQQFVLAAAAGDTPPLLVISQKAPPGTQPGDGEPTQPGDPMQPLIYDVIVTKDVSEDAYSKVDAPEIVGVGSTIAAEYNTGDLEPEDGIGAVAQDAEKVYSFDLPEGIIEEVRIRLENYVVLQFDDPPSRWLIFTSDPNGNEYHLIDECTPISGGGGDPPPPDCWFISTDPAVLADFQPGGTNSIKIRSDGVGEFDWLSFNTLEVIVKYQIDPDNDLIHRYYVQFDLSALPTSASIDSATLNLHVNTPAEKAVARVNLVDNTYDAETGAYSIFHASDADYSSLINPIKTFTADQSGIKKINVKPAVEDALQSLERRVAFLITEDQEDALFGLSASGSINPPQLDVLLTSEVSAAQVQWGVLGHEQGTYRIRVRAQSSLGGSVSDEIVVTMGDPNRPVVNSVECSINSQWQSCTNLAYGDTLEAIRVDARDPQQVPMVHLSLWNVPDDTLFVDQDLAYDGQYFMVETNLEINESGQWLLQAMAQDNDGYTMQKDITWDIPWGRLSAEILNPTGPLQVPKGSSFDVTMRTTCLDAECPDVKAILRLNEPVQMIYDDGSSEDFGDIGDSSGFIAVRITPNDYPAHLRAVRFYIWDKTTYPFELHIWDDNGSGQAPGSDLTPPRIVDPVTPSAHEIQWFDVDVSDENVEITSGDFYVGWRQVATSRNNQVGFDMNSTRRGRTWGYLDLFGWFNLDDFCDWDPAFCGNIMIRAFLGEKTYYEGDLPIVAGAGPLYSSDPYPKSCGDLKANQSIQTTLQVHAVGPVGDQARFKGGFTSAFSLAETESRQVTILGPTSEYNAANLDAVIPVGLGDLAVLAADWLKETPPLFADITGDGAVDIDDLAQIARFWMSGN
ncbi:MAG: S8 family serine peptidase [Sedimentisphaerales bacterium]|nr:S8 family serine peptidase [Sedimentisphaerales bacterium]